MLILFKILYLILTGGFKLLVWVNLWLFQNDCVAVCFESFIQTTIAMTLTLLHSFYLFLHLHGSLVDHSCRILSNFKGLIWVNLIRGYFSAEFFWVDNFISSLWWTERKSHSKTHFLDLNRSVFHLDKVRGIIILHSKFIFIFKIFT